MKYSIALAFLILIVGTATGLKNRHDLTTAREDQRKLATRARELGIAAGPTEDRRIQKRPRNQLDSEPEVTAAEIIEFFKEMELREKAGSVPADFDHRAQEMTARMFRLTPSQMRRLINSLKDDPALGEKSRGTLVGTSIRILGQSQPAAAAALYLESAPFIDDETGEIISTVLATWAEEDLSSALAWLKKNPGAAGDDSKEAILVAAAKEDPAHAFELLREIGIDDISSAIGTLVETGENPAQRTAILAALRNHLATIPDIEARRELLDESLETMGRSLTDEDFETATGWISEVKLTPEEIARYAGGLSYFGTRADTGRWIDWMANHLPEDQLAENVDDLIGQWTQQDYLAAGKWLAAAADGPAKLAAVGTYAETVAEYEPQTAVQWALTLPKGEARQDTLSAIYRNWPSKDPAGAEAFARENGVPIPSEATEEP